MDHTLDQPTSGTVLDDVPDVPAPARKPLRFATYPGNALHIVGEIKGPNTLGEYLTAVSANYQESAGTTRVGFAYTTTHDVQRHTEHGGN